MNFHLVSNTPSLAKGALLMTGAGIAFGILSTAVRFLSNNGSHLDPLFILLIRSLLGAAILVPYSIWQKVTLIGKNRVKLIWRAVLAFFGAAFVFKSLGYAPIADAVCLFKTSSLIVPIFAFFLLGEKPKRVTVTCAFVGFIGVLLIVQPGFGILNIGHVFALSASIVHGLVYVLLRSLSSEENPLTTVLYFLAGSSFLSIPFIDWPTSLSVLEMVLLVVTAITGLIGQVCLTASYKFSPAGQMTPYLYSEVVISSLLGWVIMNDVPSMLGFIGMLLICSSGIFLVRRS
jgi:drug/metabolite transporter (DMT)-like permease